MRRNQKGFSLIELMIVVAILAILSAVAIPAYMGVQKKGKRVEYQSNLEVIKLLEQRRWAEQGRYVPAASTALLKAALPHFQPGDEADLLYEYKVTCVDTAQDFTVTATGKANGPDFGNKFCVNQDNEEFEGGLCP